MFGVELDAKRVLIIAGVSVTLIGSNIMQYFLIWGPHEESLRVEYETQISTLKETIDRLGPMTAVYKVRDGLSISPGQQIQQGDLVVGEVPQSFINESYILDPAQIVGKYYKLSLRSGTPISQDLVMEDPIDNTTREYDVSTTILPIGLKVGDYVDLRLIYPLGEDYIVLSRKRVEAIHDQTVKFKLNENEIHYYQGALVDYFLQMQNGSTLYLTKYVEPGSQKQADRYYSVPNNIVSIMSSDPNIIKKANVTINAVGRKVINSALARIDQETGSKINAGRSSVLNKLAQGKVEFDNKTREAEELAKEQEAMEGQVSDPFAPPSPPGNTPNPNSTTNTGATVPSNGPELNIEDGVVE